MFVRGPASCAIAKLDLGVAISTIAARKTDVAAPGTTEV
jgi:hypothetical protein